jgi:hypothetical protein
MSVREAIDKQKAWLVPVILGVGILAIAYSLWSNRRDAQLAGPVGRVYFSDDEGKSYFADDVMKQFPFDHNGRQAFRAYVYQCGESGKPFIGLLGRQASGSDPSPKPPDPRYPSDNRSAPIQVKKPGDTKWVPFTSPEGQKLIAALCPDGRPEAVLP